MSEPFEIVDLSNDIDDIEVSSREDEAVGSKKKWWLTSNRTGERALLKFSRPDSGEDWSEKVAYEIALLLGIPGPPKLELAVYNDERATLSWSFLKRGHSLIHGNELLARIDKTYPLEEFYHVPQHTLGAVERSLKIATVPPTAPPGFAWSGGFEIFVGYLMLDALIGNTDRHHQNWAIVMGAKQVNGRRSVWVAPSYDHASSLGRDLNDIKRKNRLAAPLGRADVTAYAAKARSALYDDAGNLLATIDAFKQCAPRSPLAYEWWVKRLNDVALDPILATVDRVPQQRLSDTGKTFCKRLLTYNFERIVGSRA